MGSRRLTLLGIPYSPWSEKARWVLDHHRVEHRFREYTPLIGELGLRLRLRRWGGTVSVPVLLGGPEPIADSYRIAREAERIGTGSPLFPPDRDEDIERWHTRSEEALDIGRSLAIPRMRNSAAAKEETLPSFFPRSVRPLARPVAAIGMAFIGWKYRLDAEARRAALAELLQSLQEELGGKERYLLGTFTYADVAMATALQFVAPPDDRFVPLSPGLRECFTDRAITERFSDLLRWRDWLHREHRRPAE